MTNDEINKKYWSSIEPKKIMAGLSYPGAEVFDHLTPGARILDVGCGPGMISEYMHGKGYVVTGIDINQRVIEENKAQTNGITYLVADISEKLPFPESSFDAVIVSYVFVSIIEQKKRMTAVGEVARILKSGGYLWICEATESADYKDRYRLGKERTGEDNVALSFADTGEVKRVIRHYKESDLDAMFFDFSKIAVSRITVKSPSSGMNVESLRIVYQKS